MFILGGSVSVMVNGREVARCTVGDHVGEMCLLDTTALRSATVRAIEPTVVGKLSVEHFTQIALRHPEMWRRMALGLSHDLREWHKVHAAPRAEPAVFIGSSSEGLRIADSIYRSLRRSPVVPRLWTKGVFECSKTTIEDLIRIVDEIDFAIMVLTDDDVTRSRGRSVCSPRDNIIFELGLFMGALSRDRTYIVSQQGVDIRGRRNRNPESRKSRIEKTGFRALPSRAAPRMTAFDPLPARCLSFVTRQVVTRPGVEPSPYHYGPAPRPPCDRPAASPGGGDIRGRTCRGTPLSTYPNSCHRCREPLGSALGCRGLVVARNDSRYARVSRCPRICGFPLVRGRWSVHRRFAIAARCCLRVAATQAL